MENLVGPVPAIFKFVCFFQKTLYNINYTFLWTVYRDIGVEVFQT